MAIEKLNSPRVILPNTNNAHVSIDKPTKINVADKKLSDSAKLMIGATILAGTVALGVIGHKNNWWRKVTQKTTSATGETQPPIEPQPPVVPSKPKKNTRVKTPKSPEEIISAKFSKAQKHARRSVKQYNEVYDEYKDVVCNFQNNYRRYLDEKNIHYTIKDDGLEILNKDGKVSRKVYNLCEEGRLSSPAYFEDYAPNGQLIRRVAFIGHPSIFYYDKNGNVSKRLIPMVNLATFKPNVTVSNFRNGRLIDEAMYLQDGKVVALEEFKGTQRITHELLPGYVSLDTHRYNIGETSVNVRPERNFFDNNRSIRYNKNGDIIQVKGLCQGLDTYSRKDPITGQECARLTIHDGVVDYIEYDKLGKRSRAIFEDDNPENYVELFYENGKRIPDRTRVCPKSELDIQSLLKQFECDYSSALINEFG